MKSELQGRVIMVTGASGGIGSAIAKKFAEEGARLILHYRSNRRGAEALRKELGPCEAVILQADLARETDVKRLFAAAIRRFGRVDTLVANAGSWVERDVPMHQMTLKQWRATQDAVLTATFLSLREFLRVVARQRRGNAVLIGSTAGIFGEAGHSDYAAGKAGMVFGLTRSLKNEIARIAPPTADYCGGRINCVCPGWTVVPRTARRLGDRALVRRVAATMALPRIARPDDVAHSVVFLASDALARHLTGQIVAVAGGMEGRLLWEQGEIDPDLA